MFKEVCYHFIQGEVTDTQAVLFEDAVTVGGCKSSDVSLTSCSRGCNNMELGGHCGLPKWSCAAGVNAGFKIKCSGGIGWKTTCPGNL